MQFSCRVYKCKKLLLQSKWSSSAWVKFTHDGSFEVDNGTNRVQDTGASPNTMLVAEMNPRFMHWSCVNGKLRFAPWFFQRVWNVKCTNQTKCCRAYIDIHCSYHIYVRIQTTHSPTFLPFNFEISSMCPVDGLREETAKMWELREIWSWEAPIMENVAVSGNLTYIRHRSETNVIRD